MDSDILENSTLNLTYCYCCRNHSIDTEISQKCIFTSPDEPPPKKQKIDAEKILAGTSASQGTLSVPETPSCSSNEGKCVGFLVTKVRGISPEFNNAGIAVGIKGIDIRNKKASTFILNC